MSRIQVTFRETDDILGWWKAFLCLAIGRAQPLWQEAGVPDSIARAPGAAMAAARQFLEAIDRVPAGGRPGHRDASAVERLINETLARLANAYGEAETRELLAWMRRQFVQHREAMRWWVWSILLARLARAFPGGVPTAPAPLPPDRAERFVATVRARFGPEIRRRDEERAEAARRLPLSPIEQRFVALEVTEPGDAAEADVVTALELATRSERAYQVWAELDRWLAPAERRAVLRWARQEGASLGYPLDLIALPRRRVARAAPTGAT